MCVCIYARIEIFVASKLVMCYLLGIILHNSVDLDQTGSKRSGISKDLKKTTRKLQNINMNSLKLLETINKHNDSWQLSILVFLILIFQTMF